LTSFEGFSFLIINALGLIYTIKLVICQQHNPEFFIINADAVFLFLKKNSYSSIIIIDTYYLPGEQI